MLNGRSRFALDSCIRTDISIYVEKEKKRKGTSIMHSSGLILFVRASVSHDEYEQWHHTLDIPRSQTRS